MKSDIYVKFINLKLKQDYYKLTRILLKILNLKLKQVYY